MIHLRSRPGPGRPEPRHTAEAIAAQQPGSPPSPPEPPSDPFAPRPGPPQPVHGTMVFWHDRRDLPVFRQTVPRPRFIPRGSGGPQRRTRPRTRGEELLARPYVNSMPSPCREAVPRGRAIIADAMGGQFTLDCYHCGATHQNAQALTFPQLRRSAWDCGWRLDGYRRWVCARDARSNPLFTPMMQVIERAAAHWISGQPAMVSDR